MSVRCVERWSYDALGRVTAYTDRRDRVTRYAYRARSAMPTMPWAVAPGPASLS
ncbi:RHS repeat protein [Xanthomonas theicola]|nr:RHS repeat protein [Xanthomonas theicola]